MKGRLKCILWGHDFRRFINVTATTIEFAPSDHCRQCGLTKEELGITKPKKRL